MLGTAGGRVELGTGQVRVEHGGRGGGLSQERRGGDGRGVLIIKSV